MVSSKFKTNFVHKEPAEALQNDNKAALKEHSVVKEKYVNEPRKMFIGFFFCQNKLDEQTVFVFMTE